MKEENWEKAVGMGLTTLTLLCILVSLLLAALLNDGRWALLIAIPFICLIIISVLSGVCENKVKTVVEQSWLMKLYLWLNP